MEDDGKEKEQAHPHHQSTTQRNNGQNKPIIRGDNNQPHEEKKSKPRELKDLSDDEYFYIISQKIASNK